MLFQLCTVMMLHDDDFDSDVGVMNDDDERFICQAMMMISMTMRNVAVYVDADGR